MSSSLDNKIANVSNTISGIEKNIENQKQMVQDLKRDLDNVLEVVQSKARKDCGELMPGRTQLPAGGRDDPSPRADPTPTADLIAHPSKGALSSLTLAEQFRRQFDCQFHVSVDHPIPLATKKPVWIGGYTNQTRCPYMDLDSGVYMSSLQGMYRFTVNAGVSEGCNVKLHLCRERDGIRETVVNIIRTTDSQSGNRNDMGFGFGGNLQGIPSSNIGGFKNRNMSLGASPYYYKDERQKNENKSGQVDWECQKGDKIWVEAVRASNGGMLTDVNFYGDYMPEG